MTLLWPSLSARLMRKTGARGLRSILEDILLDTMFDLPGMDSVEEVVVNEEAVTSKAAPLMIHAEKKQEPADCRLSQKQYMKTVGLGSKFRRFWFQTPQALDR